MKVERVSLVIPLDQEVSQEVQRLGLVHGRAPWWLGPTPATAACSAPSGTAA